MIPEANQRVSWPIVSNALLTNAQCLTRELFTVCAMQSVNTDVIQQWLCTKGFCTKKESYRIIHSSHSLFFLSTTLSFAFYQEAFKFFHLCLKSISSNFTLLFSPDSCRWLCPNEMQIIMQRVLKHNQFVLKVRYFMDSSIKHAKMLSN